MSRRTIAARLSQSLVAITLIAGVARADGSSVVTLGLGAGVGIHQVGASDLGEAATAFVNQANVRLKIGHVLGLDLSYDLGRDEALTTPSAGLQYAAKLRSSVFLYPYSGDRLACYVGGGVGATSLAELVSFDGAGLSYHAGVGFEVHLASHVSIDLSFMLLVPGVDSIERTAVAKLEAAYARGGADAVRRVDTPNVGDVISVQNHEIMLRLFVFL